MLVEGRCQNAAAADDGDHVVVHGSMRYRLRIAWEVLEDEDVGHERQRALRVVKQVTEIFLKEEPRQWYVDRLVCKWYELEDWLYPQLSVMSWPEGRGPPGEGEGRHEGRGPPGGEGSQGADAEARWRADQEYHLAARRR